MPSTQSSVAVSASFSYESYVGFAYISDASEISDGAAGSRRLRDQINGWLHLHGGRPGLKGIYTLIINVGKDVNCGVGSLGSFSFSKGLYAYTGSGRGVASASIEGRIGRHLCRRKRKFWHIDFLLSLRTCSVHASVHSETATNAECSVNRKIQELTSGVFPVSGFGSSDCKCISHLIYFPSYGLNKATHSVMKTHRKLRLKPQAGRFN